jgi:hypothetical protein
MAVFVSNIAAHRYQSSVEMGAGVGIRDAILLKTAGHFDVIVLRTLVSGLDKACADNGIRYQHAF